MKLHTRQLTCAAIVGAAYAVLSIFGSIFGITYGPIQCRFSEALCVLPFLLPDYQSLQEYFYHHPASSTRRKVKSHREYTSRWPLPILYTPLNKMILTP